MKSMTGYGKARTEKEGYEMTAEIKSVNHRFLDVSLKLPKMLSSFEDNIRKMIALKLTRGRVEVSVNLSDNGFRKEKISVNYALAADYAEAAKELSEKGTDAEVICCHTIKPLDKETILTSVKKTGAVVTCENHNVIGALRSAVAEALVENSPVPLESVGVKEKFGEVGKVPYLRKAFNLEVCDVVAAAKKVISRK